VTAITPTLGSPSTAGDLLSAIVTTNANTTVTGPSGWAEASRVYTAGVGTTEIWYEANNPGAVSNARFALSSSANATAQLSEWSGVAPSSPLDGTGTATKTTNSTTLAVSATAAAGNELALTSFASGTGTGGNSFTPGAGFTNLMAASSVSDTADYRIGVGAGSVSETETASTASKWAGALATFYGSCGGGSLSLVSPATAAFPGITLNGSSQSVTTNLAFTATDATGSAGGWSLTGTSTTFTTGVHTLPTTATTVTAASAAATAGTCRLPGNTIGYPVTLPAAATPPAPVKLFDASAGTGLGAAALTLTFGLTVPAGAFRGSYSSTWTFSLASGP
jgi:hypothetical protein